MIEIFHNIREIYEFRTPCKELEPFIEFFSESSPGRTARHAAGNDFVIEMFPSWTPTFWINLGSSYHLTTENNDHHIPAQSGVLVLRDSYTTRHNKPDDHLFSVKFFPGGLEAILGIRQTKFIGKIVPLETLLPGPLLHQILSAASFEKKVALLQDFLLANLSHRPKKDHYWQLVRDSIGLYGSTGLRLNTGEIAQRLFVHSRTINRYFHTVIGLPPKKYLGIVRARSALTAYLADKKAFSPDHFGYYDMSHFYKEVTRFTGRRMAAPL